MIRKLMIFQFDFRQISKGQIFASTTLETAVRFWIAGFQFVYAQLHSFNEVVALNFHLPNSNRITIDSLSDIDSEVQILFFGVFLNYKLY